MASYNPLMTDAAGAGIDARLADWEARLERLEETEGGPDDEATREATGGHLLLVPSAGGYELVERVGAFPSPGETLELDGRSGRFAVTRIARSPLPGDLRRCALLEPI